MKNASLATSVAFKLLLCLLCSYSAVEAQTHTPRYISITSNTNAFYEYLPQAYSTETQTYPLMVFMHGVGELGNGSASSLPTVLRNGPPNLINNGTFPVSFTVGGQVFKFIVISPQFISWPTATDVQAVIDYAVKTYRVNTNRIYLTGLSMGGGVVWDYGSYNATFANRLAALVPVCGASASTPDKAQVIASANLPVWATHNQDDPEVPVTNTTGFVSAINSSTPPPTILAKQTIFPVSGHDAWTATYATTFKENNLNVYEWMLQYQRGSATPVNQLPVVNAGADVTITLPTSSVTLGGSAKDPDGTITSYSWAKTAGPTQYTISSTSVTNPAISNLTAGTYTFRLTANDNGGASNYDDVNVVVNTAPAPGAALPGRIEAENYTTMSGVQTETTSDAGAGKDVGFIDTGDWMDYAVSVATAGTFTANFRVASPYAAQQLLVKNSAGTVLATVSIPQTGAYQTWTTVTASVTLPAGNQTLRISSGNGGWNFNWLEFLSGSQAPVAVPAIPGRIEAESYSAMSGVQTENTTDAGAGQDVGFIDTGDWMDYTANVTTAGTYTVNFRVASPYTSQQLTLKNSSGTVLATVSIPQTGAWQTWTTVTATVTLPAGTQTLRVGAAVGGWNFNWLEFVSGTTTATGATIPGRIEAENYATMSGVQTETTTDAGAGKDVGFIDTGDWMDYATSVTTAGTYTVNFRVASPYTAQQLLLKNSSGTVLATVNIPQTGDWQTWTTVNATVTLPAGNQTLRIASANGGWNFNWFEFVSGTTTATGTALPAKIEAENYTTMSGVQSETTADAGAGKDVGFIDTGDWMDYAISVATAGTFTVNFRVASPYTAQQLLLKNSSGTVLATVSIPQTGAYQTWTTVSATITLPAGNQTLRVSSGNGGWNLNWVEFIAGVVTPTGAAIPGRIEAENYDAMNGVGTETTSDAGGGKSVGWIGTGDWMDYNVTVATAGNYTVNFRIASLLSGQQLQLKNSSGTVLGTLTLPPTGGYQVWGTGSIVVNLPAGYQTLRIYSSNGSWNINWVDFISGGTITTATASQGITSTMDQAGISKEKFKIFPNPVLDRFSLQLNNGHLGTIDIRIADQSGKIIKTFKFEKSQQVSDLNLLVNELSPGVYFLKVQIGNWTESKKLIKM